MDFDEKVCRYRELRQQDPGKAKQFYYDNLFDEVIQRFLTKSSNLKKYQHLISLLGFSPEPVILFIRATNPEKVLFIHSEETEHSLDLIQRWTGLTLSKVVKTLVDSSDPTGVYRAIKDFVKGKAPRSILIDITGGKKSMVGGAAMAGNLLNIDTGYVDYEKYINGLREPEPGTEYPIILKNPFQVFGDLDLEKAKEAFNRCDFDRCLNILTELDQKAEDIWGIRKLILLTKAYQRFDSFHFEEASDLIQEYLQRWPDDLQFISSEHLKKSLGLLSILKDRDHPNYDLYASLNYYFSAERFAGRRRFDIAVFLIYRTIEMVLSGALRKNGIDPSNPTYPDWVTIENYNLKLREVFGDDYYEKNLPHKVGLMDSAVLLSLRNDPLVEELNLRELKGIITLRNESHFTHGSRPLGEEDFKKIRRVGRKLLERRLSIENRPIVKEFEEMFGFPTI